MWQKLCRCVELIHRVLAYCHAGDIQRLGSTSRDNADVVRAYLQYRIKSIGAQYFSSGHVMQDILRSCDAVVSGSSALRILLPEIGPTWSPTDLDIYVPRSTFLQMQRKIPNTPIRMSLLSSLSPMDAAR